MCYPINRLPVSALLNQTRKFTTGSEGRIMTDNTKWLLGSYRPQKTVCRLIKKEFKNVLTKRTNDGIIRPSKRTREKTKKLKNQKFIQFIA